MSFIKPMLAKSALALPIGDDWRYEPKWDGFRTIISLAGGAVDIRSRDNKELNRYFPELVEMLSGHGLTDCVLDGELLMNANSKIDFSTLQLRIHPAESRVKRLASEIPASVMLFDVLHLGSDDLLDEPADKRRSRLVDLVAPAANPRDEVPLPLSLATTPQTRDTATADDWLEGIQNAGIEGVIAKLGSQAYAPGKRAMQKVKKRRSIDCVIAGYRVHVSGVGIGSLLLGLFDDRSQLCFVGHTSSFNAGARREMQELLEPLRTEQSFDEGPGGVSRWRKAENDFVAIEPILVCEVAVDKIEHGRIRHAATFLRFRNDKLPSECVFGQL